MTYQLSHAQKRLWILEQMERGSAAYDIPLALRLRGALDVEALRAALNVVVARHESLRTTFALVDGEPRQFVSDANVALHVIDATEDEARRFVRDDASAPFDLERGPLLRATLLRLGDDDHVLALNLHHIIGDEWSVNVLLRELAAFYRGDVLPPLTMQYRDYAEEHNERVARAHGHRQYWRTKLADAPLLDLPAEARPAERTDHGARFAIDLDLEPLDALRRSAGATPFQAVVALTKLLLHRWSGQEDIVIGAPFAGRDRAELDAQIGFYVNTLALRDDVRGEETFVELLRRVKQTAEEAYEHSVVPFDVVVSDLDVPRDLGRSPLFDVAVLFEERDAPQPSLGDVNVEPFDSGFTPAKFDLSFYYSSGGVVLIYNSDLFRADAIARMAGHLAQLASHLDAATPLDAIEMLTDAERAQIVDAFNDTDAAYPEATLVDLFEQQVRATPDAVAVIGPVATLTYASLDACANAVADALRERGVQPGELVAVLLPPGEDIVVSILGILKAGCAYVPIDPSYPVERIAWTLVDAQCTAVIDDEGLRTIALLPASGEKVPKADEESLAYVIYTSGSTGTPKGVAVTHRNVVRLLKNDRFPFDFTGDDVWIAAHNFCFDFSVWELFGALLTGARVVVPPRDDVRDPHRFRALLARHRVTVLNQVPAAFLNLIAAESQAPSHDLAVRIVVFGGDRLNPMQLRPWRAWYPQARLVNMYGITETTVHVTYGPLGELEDGSPIGVPLPETKVFVLNPARKPQPVGVIGEMYVGGSGVSRGYLHRDELTRERFVDTEFGRLYRSGDLGRWNPGGTLAYHGRNDQQIQVRGFRIEPREIEAALQSHRGVDRAIVLARDGELAAYVVGRVDAESLRTHLRTKLPEHMIPAYFVPIDEVPLTANQKIDVRALPALRAVPSADPVAPRDDLERALADAWQRVLRVDSLSIHDNYFTLGGDSIKVIRLLAAIDAPLEVKDIFRYPTVASLAEHIRGGVDADGALANIYSALGEDVYPMTDIQQGMIFHHLASDDAVYHDQFVYEIPDDAFDFAAFERALALLVEKHPMLRTSFDVENGMQIVHEHRGVRIESGGEAAALLNEDRKRPFDVTQPGLWRARIIRFEENRYALMWVIHHAIVDGWSNASFIAELFDTYLRLKSDPAYTPAPLKASYRDTVAHQLRVRESEETKQFWQRELEGWEHMGLPFGKSAGAGERRRLVQRIESLAALAKEEETSMRDAYLAAFAALLELSTGRGDLLFGLVTNIRPAVPDGDAVFGCHLNSVPLRISMPFPRTPRELLRLARAKLREIEPHKALSLRRIAEVHGARSLFDIIFNFNDFHILESLQRGGRAAYVYESTNTPLDVSVSSTFGEHNATFYWLDGTFDEDEIAKLATWYANLVERFASHPDEPLFRSAAASPPLWDYPPLWECIQSGGTAAALLNEAEALANQLEIENEECVGIEMSRSPRIVAAMLAIIKAGGAYVPIEPDWPRARKDFILRDTGCRFVITDDGIRPTNHPRVELPRGDSPLAYVNYTSGSTGTPKGSLIEQRSIVRLVRDTNYIDIRPEDRILQGGSIAFDACTFEVWGALLNGATVVVPEKSVLLDPARFARMLAGERITILFLTTSLFNQLAEFDPAMFNGARVLLTGGEKASPRHFNSVREACPSLDLLHVYGPTENTTFSTFHRVTGPCGDDVPIGVPITGTTAYILDRNLQPLPDGVPGEICVGGAGVARGYIHGDAGKFVDDPFVEGGRMYRTGDRGRVLPGGAIQFLGRIDHQVKIRGFRVEPGEIEQHLLARADVAQAAVLVRDTAAGTRELVAYFSGSADAECLRSALADVLPAYMIPAQFVPVGTMPVTPIGKIDRNALASITIARAEAADPPRDAREQLLARVWSDVLQCNAGIHDDYFELGGDSIKAMQINSRLRREGWRMDVRELFAHPTIAELAPTLAAVRDDASPARVTGDVPLSPVQRWFFRTFRGPVHHFLMPVLLRANEQLDEERLRDALQTLWEHHDLLRATFAGERQIIGEPTRFALQREIDPASFDLARGPLFQAALHGDELLLAAHHLIVDAVSWRILLEDLEHAYRGESLPPKTAPFSLLPASGEKVPKADEGRTLYGDARSVEATLPMTCTRETLLAALGRAFKRWHGCDAMPITIEGHGRDAGAHDFSRTVGWFTSLHPFLLRAGAEDLREQLAALPRTGVASELPRTHFNFLGEVRSGHGLFTIQPRVPLQAVSPDLERPSDLDIVAMIADGSLRISVTYDRRQHERRMIEMFLDFVEEEVGCLA